MLTAGETRGCRPLVQLCQQIEDRRQQQIADNKDCVQLVERSLDSSSKYWLSLYLFKNLCPPLGTFLPDPNPTVSLVPIPTTQNTSG